MVNRFLLLTVVALCLTTKAVGQTGQVKIMTYNLNNMHDVFDDPYSNDEGTRVKSRHEINLIARLIKKVNPDVAAFQEVENEGVLRAVVDQEFLDEGYRYIAVMATNSGRGANLGLISRLPILSFTSHRFTKLGVKNEPGQWRYARDLLRVRLAAMPDKPIDLYIVHFKSKRDSESDPESSRWRLAEAHGTRRIIDEARSDSPNDWTLLVGDFNDTPDSLTIAALLAPQSQNGGLKPLIDLHRSVPPKDRITYLRRPYHDTVDYILASPRLASRVVSSSARVLADARLLGGSDHAPVVVTFDLN